MAPLTGRQNSRTGGYEKRPKQAVNWPWRQEKVPLGTAGVAQPA